MQPCRLRKAKVKGEGDHITPMGSQQLPGGLALQGKEELCQATYQLIASKLQVGFSASKSSLRPPCAGGADLCS